MASGVSVKDLEGKKERGEGETLTPRDFFWDSVALFVISAIVGLTVLDVVTEFVRGSNVECYLPEGIGNVTQEYVNTFCSGNLPFTQYFPVYIIITGALLAIPHYLWLNQYRGNFEFFFSQVSNLNRLTDAETVGTHSQQNIQIVKQLTTAFVTYKQSTIFLFYIIKLCFQWLFTAGSTVTAIILFRNSNFMDGFRCPEGSQTLDEFWPFNDKAFCIYNTLVLISYLRVAYLCLICLLLICLSWAIVWCFFTHATELGHKDVAEFSYLTGLPTKYYVAQLPIPGWSCCWYLRSCLLKCVTTIPWFTFGGGPRIRSDLDFMVMQLFRTDSGLGYTFKDIQTSLALKDLLDDDQRRLHIHFLKHTNKLEYDEVETKRKVDTSEKYLKWKFSKEKGKRGLYFEYKAVPKENSLKIPDTLLGAILGYAACSPLPKIQGVSHPDDAKYCSYPKIMNALSISFDSVGYGTTLARAFNWVGSVNFSSTYDPEAEEPAECTTFYSNMVSIVCKENILSADTDTRNKLEAPLRKLWFPTPDRATAYETSFIVLGPIPNDNPGHLTTVDLFLDEISECLGKEAVLLTLTPETTGGKNVKGQFSEYVPRKSRFVEHDLIVENEGGIIEWKARKSVQQKESREREEAAQSKQASAADVPTDKNKDIRLLEMGSEETSDETETKPRTHEYPHHLKCGNTKVTMKFTTYCSTGFNYRSRRPTFKPQTQETTISASIAVQPQAPPEPVTLSTLEQKSPDVSIRQRKVEQTTEKEKL